MTEKAPPAATGAAAVPTSSEAASGSLQANSIGLGASVIIAMAGAAPAQVLAVALVPLIAATAYGLVPSMLVTVAAMMSIAVAFNRLNLWTQDAGGPYKWVGRAVTPSAGFLVGWILFATFAVTVLTDVLTIGPAVLGLLGMDTSSSWGAVISAVLLGGFLVVVASVGLRPTARLQIVFAIAEYLILLGFAAVALFHAFVSHPDGTVTPSVDFLKFGGIGGGSFAAGMLVAIYWIAEWDAGIYEAEETAERERSPGLAAMIAVAVLGVMYTIMSVAFATVAPQAALERHAENALVFAAGQIAGGGWTTVMALAVVSSVLATVLASIVATSRIAFSMARDRVMPKVFGKVSARFRTPIEGTIIIGGLAIVLVPVSVFSSSLATALEDLIETSGVLFAVYYAATGLTVVWLYRRRFAHSLKDTLLSGVLPLAASILLIWIAYKGVLSNTAAQNWVLVGILLLGIVALLIARFGRDAEIFRAESGVALDPVD